MSKFNFYPRPPRGGRRTFLVFYAVSCYFYPRPPRGGRPRRHEIPRGATYFYPRPPRGGRPRNAVDAAERHHFYPRPPRGGRQVYLPLRGQHIHISIHALREEGDSPRLCRQCRLHHFYPRPPRGGRPLLNGRFHGGKKFLSTPSARRATAKQSVNNSVIGISIHALREEGDSFQPWRNLCRRYFYPRPPRGGRPGPESVDGQNCGISIHALREEGD